MQQYCCVITWFAYIFFYNNSNFLSLSIKRTLHPISRSFIICTHFTNRNSKVEKKKCGQMMSEKGN